MNSARGTDARLKFMAKGELERRARIEWWIKCERIFFSFLFRRDTTQFSSNFDPRVMPLGTDEFRFHLHFFFQCSSWAIKVQISDFSLSNVHSI